MRVASLRGTLQPPGLGHPTAWSCMCVYMCVWEGETNLSSTMPLPSPLLRVGMLRKSGEMSHSSKGGMILASETCRMRACLTSLIGLCQSSKASAIIWPDAASCRAGKPLLRHYLSLDSDRFARHTNPGSFDNLGSAREQAHAGTCQVLSASEAPPQPRLGPHR